MKLYNSCKSSIKVTFFAVLLITIGFLIKNENVNLFYTFRSPFILFIGEFFYDIGTLILMNLPLIFMLNGVCKKSSNASVVITAIVGYFTYMVTTMLFAPQNLGSQAYAGGTGINSIFNSLGTSSYPLETGMLGSLLVAIATRISFLYSRNKNNYSLFNIFSKEISGLIINVILCFLLGIGVSYLSPYFYSFLNRMITFISGDLLDPYRIGLYSALDRFFSDLGLGSLIRNPFWYTALGGSYSNTATGEIIVGDINIWQATKNAIFLYEGAGRFTTFYYVINMFIIPAIYLGTWFSITDKKEKNSWMIPVILGVIASVIAGNPLPMEYVMMFTAPFLYIFYLTAVGVVSGALIYFKAYLGFSPVGDNIVSSMPGSFPDFVINLRNPFISSTLMNILYVGIAAFAVCFFVTYIYYHYLSIDFADTGVLKYASRNIIDVLGGKENISGATGGILRLNVEIRDPEVISIEGLKELGPDKIVETKNGISLEYGTSSIRIAKEINRRISK